VNLPVAASGRRPLLGGAGRHLGRHGKIVGGGPLAQARVIQRESRGAAAEQRDGGEEKYSRADPAPSVGEHRLVSDACRREGASELVLWEEAARLVEERLVGDVGCGGDVTAAPVARRF